MTGAIDQFIALSIVLTGYDRSELHATGMVETYYDTLTGILGGKIVGDLLSAWEQARTEAGDAADALDVAVRKTILEDSRLGSVARNLITLWYLGQWQQMPGAWRNAHGAAAGDLTHVVSAEAYREGLVWSAIDAHPMGAKQQGYGAWALPPALAPKDGPDAG